MSPEEEALRAAYLTHPVYNLLGVAIDEIGPDGSRLTMPLSPQLQNRAGTMHGGIIATLVDCGLGSALRGKVGPQHRVATTELKVNYLEPVRSGPVVTTGKMIRVGRHLAVGTVEVHDGDGTLCAYATGTLMLMEGEI